MNIERIIQFIKGLPLPGRGYKGGSEHFYGGFEL